MPQDMAGYEPFIVGMLTNFDALPLDRIHNMLKVRACFSRRLWRCRRCRRCWRPPPLLLCSPSPLLCCQRCCSCSCCASPHTPPPLCPPPPPPPSRPQMFANDPPYDKSLEQLGAYLSALVAEERLSCEGGLYRKRS